jgi:hypothetical protein
MSKSKPRVAVLGTLAEFHHGAVSFDLDALVELVVQVNPDLLCLDMNPDQWRQKQFDALPPEYRHALLPLAERSDIVVVPIGDSHSQASPEATGLRRILMDWLRQRLAALQRRAPSPEAINYGWRHDVANTVYSIMDALDRGTNRAEKVTHISELIENIKQVAQRDPAAEILVVVNVRYCHHIRPVLDRDPGIELVPFTKMRGQR